MGSRKKVRKKSVNRWPTGRFSRSFHHARHEADDLGATAGTLYAWNTVGSLLGALLGGYLLLFWLDIDQVYGVAIVALGGAAALLALELSERARWPLASAIAGASVLALIALPAWNPEILYSGLFRQRHVDRVAEQEDGEPDADADRAAHEREAGEQEQHARDHGVAHVAVGARDDEFRRRAPAGAGRC